MQRNLRQRLDDRVQQIRIIERGAIAGLRSRDGQQRALSGFDNFADSVATSQ